MLCPSCSSQTSKITDSRYKDNELLGSYKYRKRKCECGHTWKTYEFDADMKELERAFKLINHPKTNSHWTNDEDLKLVELRKKGHKIAYIALELGRSTESIRKRVGILGVNY